MRKYFHFADFQTNDDSLYHNGMAHAHAYTFHVSRSTMLPEKLLWLKSIYFSFESCGFSSVEAQFFSTSFPFYSLKEAI